MKKSTSRTKRLCVLVGSLALVVWGCGEPDGSSGTASQPHQGPGEIRIASLSPALTTMAIDLGLGDAIVGSTPFCRGLPEPVAVVGSLTEVDAELLIRVEPTLLLVQPSAGGIDPALEDLARRRGMELVVQPLDSLKDVQAALRAIGASSGGAVSQAKLEGLCQQIEELQRPREAIGPRTVVLYGVEPLGAAGSGTYLDELLRAAGGQNALARSGWLELSEEELLAMRPEVVLIMGTSQNGGLQRLPWKESPRICHLDAPDALEPSSRVVVVVESLRRVLESPQ